MRLASEEQIVKRLSRIEGQARGIQRMVREGRDCSEIVQQLSALRAAVDRAGFALVSENLRTCVAAAELDLESRRRLDEGIAVLAGMRS